MKNFKGANFFILGDINTTEQENFVLFFSAIQMLWKPTWSE
jgi:hypothetical protein